MTLFVLLILTGMLVRQPSGAAAQSTAEYVVRFDATWSAATHPLNFPPNPHFSGLIGGTHSDQVAFWNVGELASPGIKNMAETGSKSPLDDEVQAAINAGTARAIISGGGIASSPGSVSETFTIEDAHPLVTLVSMLAPSPDWFVGVSGLSLREGGEWVESKVVELAVFDAGTDSGTDYRSPNNPTIPPVTIFEKTDGPFAQNNIVGTFTFSRLTVGVPDVPDAIAQSQTRLVPLGPNPLRGSSRFEVSTPEGVVGDLALYDVGGRHVRTLLRGNADRGSIVAWDGRDGSGVPVATGVYYIRLIAGTVTRVERIVVAR
jgi:hypothetical protein